MLYFQPANLNPDDGNVTSVVPFTGAAQGTISSKWVVPRRGADGRYEHTGRVCVNGVVVWEKTDLCKAPVANELHKVIAKINNLAARDAKGIYDLME